MILAECASLSPREQETLQTHHCNSFLPGLPSLLSVCFVLIARFDLSIRVIRG